MKKILAICSLIMFASLCSAQVNLHQGLLLHLPFNGTMNDFSTNGLTVTPFNGPTYTLDKQGNANSAILLDGVDDYLEVSSNGELSPRQQMSFFLRFKSDLSTLQTILGKVNYNTAYDKEYQVAINWSAQPGALFGIATTNGNDCNTSTPLFSQYSKTGTNSVQVNTWYCLAGTYDGSKLKIYLDGQLMDSINANGLVDSCSNPSLLIGKWWVNETQTYSGALDEIRMYNRSINQQEIDSLCNFFNEWPESVSESELLKRIITISPNPSNQGTVTISCEKELNKKARIQIRDLQGRSLKQYKLESLNNSTIDVSDYVKGVYFLEIKVGDVKLSKKILVN